MIKRLYKSKNNIGNGIDDRHEVFNMYSSQCASCKHFIEEDYYCKAFPDGIPDNILNGLKKHNIIIKGQEGDLVYEKE